MWAILATATAVLTSVLVHSTPVRADGERSYGYVARVNVWDDGYLRLAVSHPGGFSDHGCPEPAFARSAYPLNNDTTKAMLQIATASFLSQANVHIWTYGCDSDGEPVIYHMQLER